MWLASEGKQIHPAVVGRPPDRGRHVQHRCSHCVSSAVVPQNGKMTALPNGVALHGTASQGTRVVRRYRNLVSCFLDTKESMLDECPHCLV